MIHKLKILPEYFIEVVSGNKTFEVRKNDRDYKVGDTLILQEWMNEYTGNEVEVIVPYILKDPNYCKDNYVIMAIKLK